MQNAPSAPAKTPWGLLAVFALVPAFDAVFRLGRLHPDEVFQVLEPALHRARGYGVVAWEWEVGLRNWAVPGLFSFIIKFADALGVQSPWAQRVILEIPQYALTLGMLGAVFRLSARRVGAPMAMWCVALVTAYPPFIWFAGRTMGESLSVAFLVWGLERLDAKEEQGAWPALLGGALLGFAEVARYGSAAVIAPAMLWLLLTRRFKTFGLATLSGLAVALALGLLDLVTWGDWFHSLIAYVKFNVLSNQAAERFGVGPIQQYVKQFMIAPWAAIGGLLWLKKGSQRIWLFAVPAAVYWVAITATPHKEARFLYPTLMLLLVAGTPEFVRWAAAQLKNRTAPMWKTAVAIGSVALGIVAFVTIPTPIDVDRPEQFQLQARAWQGSTGLAMLPEGIWGTGGYFYLGGQLPFCSCDFAADACFQVAMSDARFNRVVVWAHRADAELTAAGWHVAETRGPGQLWVR